MPASIQLEKLKPSSAITFVFLLATLSSGFAVLYVCSPNIYIELNTIKLSFLAIPIVLPILCLNAVMTIYGSKKGILLQEISRLEHQDNYVLPPLERDLLAQIDLNEIIISSAVFTNFVLCAPLLLKIILPFVDNGYIILLMVILEVGTIITLNIIYKTPKSAFQKKL